jgi:drug/metabolite transporter (DMT)-like permease
MLLWALVLFSPIAIFGWRTIPPVGWALILFSSLFEAGYFIAIALAYRGADLSVVYPLARGTGPVLLLVWSVLILREPLTPGGIFGVSLIAVGLYAVNLPRPGAWREPIAALKQAGPRWALAAGACISGYTAIDKIGIGYVSPLLYTYVALWVTFLWLVPWTLWYVGAAGLRAEWRLSRWRTVLAGFTTLGAYSLVLLAMAGGTPAGYAGAIREVSVVLGAGYGVFVLKEPGGSMRILGAGLVALGVTAIGVLG